jgi:transposase InsO family protein
MKYVYSRYVVCRALTNMRIGTIMNNLKEMIKEISIATGKKEVKFPENINCDNQFNVPDFRNFFTEHGTRPWFSQPEQPHNNALIEIFWRTLALHLQKMRTGVKYFDWDKELPNVIKNYNTTWHLTLKATPLEVISAKKDNPVEKKVL